MSAVCTNIPDDVYARSIRLGLLPPVCNFTPCRFCDAERRRRVQHLPNPTAPDDRQLEERDEPAPTWDTYEG